MRFKQLCKIIGHHWLYKDYTKQIKQSGVSYNYDKKRVCGRCGKKEFKFAEWVDEKLIPERIKTGVID